MSSNIYMLYPKLDAASLNSQPFHPNTADFNSSFASQEVRLEQTNLRPVAQKLPSYKTWGLGYNKYFHLDGIVLFYPIVLWIGNATGSVWACPDGNVIRRPFNAYEGSKLYTPQHMAEFPLKVDRTPAPFKDMPALRMSLTSPMPPEALALVRYNFVLRARNTDLTKYRLAFPEFDKLVAALVLFAPGTRPRRYPPLKLGDFTLMEPMTHAVESVYRISQDVVRKHPAHQPEAYQEKFQKRVLNARQKELFARKKDRKTRVAKNHYQADYKDWLARKLMNQAKDADSLCVQARELMDEAAKLRQQAKADQAEVNDLDGKLAVVIEMETEPEEHSEGQDSQTRIAHLTQSGVRDLLEE
jgi:hypothetical protein